MAKNASSRVFQIQQQYPVDILMFGGYCLEGLKRPTGKFKNGKTDTVFSYLIYEWRHGTGKNSPDTLL